MGACCEAQRENYRKFQGRLGWNNNDFDFLDEQGNEDWSQAVTIFSLIKKGEDGSFRVSLDKELLRRRKIKLEVLRGYGNLEIKIDNEKLDTSMWSVLLYAVAFKQVGVVKELVNELGMNTSFCLKEPLFSSESEGPQLHSGFFLRQIKTFIFSQLQEQNDKPTADFWNSSLALMLAVNHFDTAMLEFLWNDLYYLWDLSDLDSLIDYLYNAEFLDALHYALNGRAFKSNILALSFESQVFYLEKILLDKFDRDTQFAISSFIDAELSRKDFATQYLFLLLKRGYVMRETLEKCFQLANHLLIQENGQLFLSILDMMDPKMRQDIKIQEALIRNIISKGGVNITEEKFIRNQIFQHSKSGNLNALKKILENYPLKEVCQLKDKQLEFMPFVQDVEEILKVSYMPEGSNLTKEDVLRDWNPLQIAIFFEQLPMVKFFCEQLQVNLRIGLLQPGQQRNKEGILKQQKQPLVVFLLKCFKRQPLYNDSLLLYFWQNHAHLFTEQDLRKVTRLLLKKNHFDLLRKVFQGGVGQDATASTIIRCMSFQGRLAFLAELLDTEKQVQNWKKRKQGEGYSKSTSLGSGAKGKAKSDSSGQASLSPSPYFDANQYNDPCLYFRESSTSCLKDIFCCKQYALYALILFLDQDCGQFFKKAYPFVDMQDLAELLTAYPQWAQVIVLNLKVKEKKQVMKQKLESYPQIKQELKGLVERIEASPLFSRYQKEQM